MSQILYRLRFYVSVNRGRIMKAIDVATEVLNLLTIYLLGSLYGIGLVITRSYSGAIGILYPLFIADGILYAIVAGVEFILLRKGGKANGERGE